MELAEGHSVLPASICFYLPFKGVLALPSYSAAFISSLSGPPFPKSTCLANRRADFKITSKEGRSRGAHRIHPGTSLALYVVFEDPFIPLLEESGPHFQHKNKAWLQKITKALSQKVTQACGEHLHGTAGDETRACSLYLYTFFKANKTQTWPQGEAVSCLPPPQAAGCRRTRPEYYYSEMNK